MAPLTDKDEDDCDLWFAAILDGDFAEAQRITMQAAPAAVAAMTDMLIELLLSPSDIAQA